MKPAINRYLTLLLEKIYICKGYVSEQLKHQLKLGEVFYCKKKKKLYARVNLSVATSEFVYSVKLLAEDDTILGNFSIKEIKTILTFNFIEKTILQNHQETLFKLRAYARVKEEGYIFTIENLINSGIEHISVQQIMNKKNLLLYFSKEDLITICTLIGEENVLRDIRLISQDYRQNSRTVNTP